MNMIVLTDVDFYSVIQPILEILDAIPWPIIAIAMAVGSIYCVFLEAKIFKTYEQNSREKAKRDLSGNTHLLSLPWQCTDNLKVDTPTKSLDRLS